MTLSEFKAWLDGFGRKMGDAPTPDEWAEIKAKLATVEALRLSPSVPQYPSPYAPPYRLGEPGWRPSFGEVTCSNSGAN